MTDEDYVPHVVLAHKAGQVSALNQRTGSVETFDAHCFVSTWYEVRNGTQTTNAVVVGKLTPGSTFYTGRSKEVSSP